MLLQPYKTEKLHSLHIITLLTTIEIIICFNIPYFQLLLLWVVINFHEVLNYLLEMGMVE
jgi:hypothetical protein